MCFSRPPVCEVCPNYEVVVFQPCTVTPPHLGSCCLLLNFKTIPPAPTFSSAVLWIVFFSIFPTASPSVSVQCQSPLVFHPLPTSSPRTKRRPPGLFPHPPPESLPQSSLHPAPRACELFSLEKRYLLQDFYSIT